MYRRRFIGGHSKTQHRGKTSGAPKNSLHPGELFQKERLGETQHQEEIIVGYLPIIRRMASELALRNPGALDVEDLTSAGVMGLLSAISRYDPDREAKFRTFAEYRIRGAMLDEIRAMDWVPRSVRTQIDRFHQASIEFTKLHGHPPSQSEIGEMLGINMDDVPVSSRKEAALLSIDDTVGNEDDACTLKDILPAVNQPDPLSVTISKEAGDVLRAAIGRLPDRQRSILQLYYFSGLTMKAIGDIHGLTESGVCRIHAEALTRIKADLESSGTNLRDQLAG